MTARIAIRPWNNFLKSLYTNIKIKTIQNKTKKKKEKKKERREKLL